MENSIAHRLKAFRMSLGISQGEFGDRCSISQRTYANLENGKTKKVSSDYLNQITSAFPQLSAKWLRLGVGDMLSPAGQAPRPMPENFEEAVLGTQLPMMAVSAPDIGDMSEAEQIAYWRARYEREARLRKAEQEAKEHEDTMRLIGVRGGKKLCASQDAAEDADYTPPIMVAETNSDYNEALPVEQPVRRIGFLIGASLR